MVTLENHALLDAHAALLRLATRTLPIPLALAITRTSREIAPLAEDVQKGHRELIEQHAERDPETGEIRFSDANQIRLKPEHVSTFLHDCDALMKAPVDVVHTLAMSHFEGVDGIEPEILIQLGNLLTD